MDTQIIHILNEINGFDYFRPIGNISSLINGLQFDKLTDTSVKNTFMEICKKIIKENDCSFVNKILMHQLQTHIISMGGNFCTLVLYDIFSSIYQEFSDKITEKESDIKWFINERKKIDIGTRTLSHVLYEINNSYKKIDSSKFTIISTVKNYCDLVFLISKTYDGKKLYEYFLEKNGYDLQNILSFMKLYDFFDNFTYYIKNGDVLYPAECRTIVLSQEKQNNFLNDVIVDVNKRIIDLCNTQETDKTKINKHTNSIRTILKLTPKIVNKSIFMSMYNLSLRNRLLKSNTNIVIESELLNSLVPKYNLETYIKIKNQLNDMSTNVQHNTYFRQTQYEIKNVNLKNVLYDRSNANFKVHRSYDWDIKTPLQFHVPNEIYIYMKMFETYYYDRFGPNIAHRKLLWINDLSSVIFEITNVNGQVFDVKMNLAQASVYQTLLNQQNISELNMDNTQLVASLNSLMNAKLISPNNVINNEFSSTYGKLSIMEYYDRSVKLIQNMPANETVTKAKMTAKIMVDTCISKQALFESLQNLNITRIVFEKCLTDVLTTNPKMKLERCHTNDDCSKIYFMSTFNDEIIELDDLDIEI